MRVLVAAGLLAMAPCVGAQGVIDGVVTDTALAPLAGVAVSVVGSRLQLVTNGAGRFRMHSLPAGRYVLVVQRIGYVAGTEIFDLTAGDTIRPSFQLAPAVHTLGTVAVEARATSAKMAEFDLRRKAGEGQFMTQDEIRARNSVTITDLLRTFKGVGLGNDGRAVNRRSPDIMGRVCYFQYYIDDVAMPPSFIRDLPSPNEIAGIEVYTSSASMPPRYKSTSGGGFCGVILLWTKDGSV